MIARKIRLLIAGSLLTGTAMGQNMISMTSVHPVADTTGASKTELALRYPILRQFSIETNGFDYGRFDVKKDDQPGSSGQIKTWRTHAFFNTPAVTWGDNALSATVFYTYTAIRLKEVPYALPDKSTINLALNYSRSDSIFHHPVVYSLIANFISDELSSVRRFNFNGSASFPLVRKRNTTFSLGALVLIDPSSPVPVVPIINYYHRFAGSGIELIVDVPTGVNVKKEVFHHAWLSAGSNQHSYATFYDQDKTSFNTIEVKNGLAFEYLLANRIVLGVGGGINNTVSGRVFKNGEHFNDAGIVSKNKAVPYVNVNLSLLAF